MKPKEVTLKDMADAEAEGTILARNLDLAEEIVTRAAKVAYETLDGFAGGGLDRDDILDSMVMVALIAEFINVLNSGR